MKDLTKYFIDLRKCSEEQRKHIISLLPEPRNWKVYAMFDNNVFLNYNADEWIVGSKIYIADKQELLYPEFIKLFEGGEGENNGWIKIESEADLPRQVNNLWLYANDGSIILGQWCIFQKIFKTTYGNNFDSDGIKFTHYQPISVPEPPKF